MKTKKTGDQPLPATKENETKRKIITAAKKIFSEYPYGTASIRMIGNAAGVNYPLVAYYFPSKAALYEAVFSSVCNEYSEANELWLNETRGMGATRGLSLYVDRMLDYAQEHPEFLRTVLLNMVQAREFKVTPGHQTAQDFFARLTRVFKRTSEARASDKDIGNFTQNFNVLYINFVGAGDYYAAGLGMDPQSPRYRKWIKDNLLALFLPVLKELIRGSDRKPGDKKKPVAGRKKKS